MHDRLFALSDPLKEGSERPPVSVIMPCYNQERYPADSLRSVFGQTYRNVEGFVVDDGATDRRTEVARILEYRIVLGRQNNRSFDADAIPPDRKVDRVSTKFCKTLKRSM